MIDTPTIAENRQLREQLAAAQAKIAELESKLADAPNRHLAEGIGHKTHEKKLDTGHHKP